MTDSRSDREAGHAWQVGVWDKMTAVYAQDIDSRFIPVVDHVMARAALGPEMRVLDVGTGTGSVALRSAALVPSSEVVGVDISPLMLEVAARRAADAELDNVCFVEGRAEALPCANGSFDRVLASLSLMYSLDRPTAAREIARALRPGGRVVAAFWAGPEHNDIVRFQQMAGSFAPEPPVPGVGPGSMANGDEFAGALADAGIRAELQTETPGFEFERFDDAWQVLVGVTATNMAPDRVAAAKAAVREEFWPKDGGVRSFSNLTWFVVGHKA